MIRYDIPWLGDIIIADYNLYNFSHIDPVGVGGHLSLISDQTSAVVCVGVGALSWSDVKSHKTVISPGQGLDVNKFTE